MRALSLNVENIELRFQVNNCFPPPIIFHMVHDNGTGNFVQKPRFHDHKPQNVHRGEKPGQEIVEQLVL